TSCLALNVADDLLRALSLSHRILLPFGPGVSLISSTYLVQPSLNPNTLNYAPGVGDGWGYTQRSISIFHRHPSARYNCATTTS
ncbi:MAG: hypothetical protein P8R42_06510, partial [Candidatus Binatia bacterium]|nr:hypothetical protein [Candidatus Binatia bacterium]